MMHRTEKRIRGAVPGRALLALFLLWAALVSVAGASEADDLLVRLKVAYIYNFTRFIDWPGPPPDRPFVIGVVADPEMAEGLRVLEMEKRQAEGRPIEIHTYPGADAIGACEVLFVGREAETSLDAIVKRSAGAPVLLVGDTPGFAGRGAAIEFFLKPDVFREKQKLRFRIDPAALAGRGLSVSAQLLDVAEVIE